jgi:uncharacterized protein (TIGR02246 family)
MQCSLASLVVLGIGLTAPAFAQNAGPDVKKECEKFNAAGATGDAAKFTKAAYTENAVMMGTGIKGVLVGREAIEKFYAEVFKTAKAISNDCDDISIRPLSNSTALITGHWTATPKDPNGTTFKGSFAVTLVKEGEDQWLMASDSWDTEE